MRKKSQSLSKAKVIVVSHIFADGPAQALVRYLTEKNIARSILFIGHPLLPVPNGPNISFLFRYFKGAKKEKIEKKNIGQRFSLHYLDNFITTIYWVLRTDEKWNVFIGANNLNALSGIILKWLGRTEKVVFYCVDFAPKRFSNQVVDFLYHFVDRLVVSWVDEIWCLSPRMNDARKKYKKLSVDPQKSKIVPMGIWSDEIKTVPFSKVNKHTLVFMGHLLKKQGVQFVIKATPEIIKKIKDFKFIVIGKGEYQGQLKKLAEEEKVEKFVNFTGYINDHSEMERTISRCACAVALYEKGDLERNFTYYADPGKIKDYLGAGLPVIVTNVPHNAYDLKRNGCGIVINHRTPGDIVEAVVGLMNDEKKLQESRQKALLYVRQFDWKKIFDSAFTEGILE